MKTNTAQQNIPNGWQERKLGDVCDIVNGSTPKRSVSEYWENGSIPWFTVDDIRSNGRIINKTNQSITDKALKETSVKLLPEDSVLLCCTASLGEVALTKIPLTTNQQFNGLVSKDKANLFPYYLFYSVQKLGEGLKSKSGKTTINFLSVGSLSKEKVLVPPIKEQKKIAEILGTVDEDIARTQEMIKATEKLKRGLMQQLFTRGIGHIKFKKTELGEIPAEWNYKKLNEITRQITDGTHRTPKYTQEGVPFLRVTDIQTEKIDWSDIKHISLEEHKELIKRCKPEKGDVLLSKNGTIGITKVVDWDEEFSIFVSLCLIKPDTEQISAKYLCEILRSDFTLNQVKMRSKQGTVTNLHLVEVRDFDIPVPKISEQKKIIEILSAIDEKILVNKELKDKLTLLKKGLMQDLLSGKVRVKK